MHVKLITTPAVDRINWTPPIGISLLAGVLKANGIETHCVDLNPDFEFGEWIPNDVLGFPEIEGATLLCRIWPEVVQKWATLCLDGNPDFIGMSVLYAGMLVPSLALAMEIKTMVPTIPICFGGPFAVPSNQQLITHILQSGVVDGILQGDGEEVIVDLVFAAKDEKSLATIPGMLIKNNGRTSIKIPPQLVNLENVPFADFSDFPLDKYYRAHEGKNLPICASRGCVNRCTFCNCRKVFPQFFQRPAEHIIEEIRRNIESYGITTLTFTDNLINGNPRELKKLCRMLIQEKITLKLGWGYFALIPSVDEEMLDLLQEAGFCEMNLGVESPAPKVRKDMGKWDDMEKVMGIIQGLVQRSLRPSINLMHSFPTESNEDFEQLLHFVDDFAPSDFYSVAYYPFRLTNVQPGEIDMNFVQRFGLKLEPGYGFDVRHARIAFGREPKWSTDYVNDSITIERQYKLREHITKWYHNDSTSQPTTIKPSPLSLVKHHIKSIPGAALIVKNVKKMLLNRSSQ